MPTFGYTDTSERYQENLDLLEVIIQKFQDTHQIVIVGDMNATLNLSRRNDSDKRFREFVHKFNIHLPTSMGNTPTYEHGAGSSQIDYILANNDNLVQDLSISTRHTCNSSAHVPISCSLNCSVRKLKTSTDLPSHQKRILWDKTNVHLYRQNLQNSKYPPIESPDQIKTYVDRLHGNLLVASNKAIPTKQIRLKGPKWKASPAVHQLRQKGKELHKQWIELGKPTSDHDIVNERRIIKRQIRSQQRQDLACERKQFYTNILEAEGSVNFYKLIRRGLSNTVSNPRGFRNEGQIILKLEEQCKGFSKFYEDLAVPKQLEQFDDTYQNQTADNINMIRSIVNNEDEELIPISEEEVTVAISNLNNKKAADEFGISAEHFKLAGPTIITAITNLFNAILQHGHIPPQFLSGTITPVYKKGRDPTEFSNYRGITVSSTLGKILEHIIRNRIEHLLPFDQSKLQFGFTKGTSILLAALVINESIVEAQEMKLPLYIAFLDSQKAFDVVDHQSLKCKLFFNGITGKLWTLLDAWYCDLTSKVKWNGHLSDSFPVRQGVRQGGILSTNLYKCYINDLLLALEFNRIGAHIGTTYVGCPTVADDLALVANNKSDLQLMLDMTNTFANRERYIIHPEKSTILMRVPSNRSTAESTDWKLGDSEVSISDTAKHLGILRENKLETTKNVEDRISCARKTLYSLTGTGLHGTNGLPPTTCVKLFNTYVLPRLLYGLETFVLKQIHFDLLEKFHINFLRKIQCLSDKSVKGITYLLLGVRPITAELHIRQLNLFNDIIRSDNQTMKNILIRQLNVKSADSKSWFINIINILELYGLPSVKTVLQTVPPKLTWKKKVKTAVDAYWNEKLKSDCNQKSSLKLCDISQLAIGKVHPIWMSVSDNIKDVRRGGIKIRLLTGTYILQTKVSKFNQYEVDDTCPLCQIESEDTCHFIIKCNALHQYRTKHLNELKSIICEIDEEVWRTLSHDLLLLTKVILEPETLCKLNMLACNNQTLSNIETCTRKMCYSLHSGRLFIVNSGMSK